MSVRSPCAVRERNCTKDSFQISSFPSLCYRPTCLNACVRVCVYTAIVLMASVGVVAEVLLSASRLGLTDGQRAFIHVDTRTALNVTSQLAMSVPFISRSIAELNSSRTERLMAAAQALLIVKAHAASLATDVHPTPYKVLLTRYSRLPYGEDPESLSHLSLIYMYHRVVTDGRTDRQTEFP